MKYEMRYNFTCYHMILRPSKIVVITKTHSKLMVCVIVFFIFLGQYHVKGGEIGYQLDASSNGMLQI